MIKFNIENGLLLLLISGVIYVSDAQTLDCLSPEGLYGHCKIIHQCDSFFSLIKKIGISSSRIQSYLQRSFCGFDGSYSKICCPAQSLRQPITPPNNKSKVRPNFDPRSLLPKKCGIDYSNKIVGGEKMTLEEFPWLALLDYQSPKGISSGCGGALITKRYVLTAGHCVMALPLNWQLKHVRLGEYNVKSDSDCLPDGDGSQTCADRVVVIGVERQIPHESYGRPRSYSNDVALLRLSRDVSVTNFIQPICLPTNPSIGHLYWSAGWGQTEYQTHSSVKLKVSLPVVGHDECARLYASKRVILDDNQICAGGRVGQDTCKGDSGGPLMRQIRGNPNHWIIDGIVSIGHSPCGLPGWPAVYTKVYNYVPWVLKNLHL